LGQVTAQMIAKNLNSAPTLESAPASALTWWSPKTSSSPSHTRLLIIPYRSK
jgi:hypothetical protein